MWDRTAYPTRKPIIRPKRPALRATKITWFGTLTAKVDWSGQGGPPGPDQYGRKRLELTMFPLFVSEGIRSPDPKTAATR